MKIWATLLLNLFVIRVFAQFDTVGPIDKRIINTVIEVENGPGIGSGFLVKIGQKSFLVTNKHMIGQWSPVDSLIYSDSIFINLYSSNKNEPIIIKRGIQISKSGNPILSKIKVHRIHKIDIAVVDITDDIDSLSIANTMFIDTTYFLRLDELKNNMTYGSHVFSIGYPGGNKDFRTNQPLVKSGYLASSLDGQLVTEQLWENRLGQRIKVLTEGKIFIVDGLIIQGNSGGPVVMSQEVVWFEFNGQLMQLHKPRNYFIGIISNITYGGLATIFASDHILEVIRQFSK